MGDDMKIDIKRASKPPASKGSKAAAANKRHMFKKTMTVNHNEEIMQEVGQDVQEANMQKALQYKDLNMVRDENKQEYPLGVDIKEFSKYGIGTRLFFEFVKLSAICFAIMAFISIPSIYSNLSGDGLSTNFSASSSNYVAMSLANQPELKLLQPTENASEQDKIEIRAQNDRRIENFVIEMDDRRWWIIIPDMVYTSVFVLFIFLWRYRSKQIKKESIIAEASPSHYAIYAWGFSTDIQDPIYLKKHFSQFGHIQEVALVRNYFGTLFHHKKEADILHKMAIEKKRLQLKDLETSKKLEKLDTQLHEVQAQLHKITSEKLGSVVSHDKYPSLGAYIVFNRIEDKLNCIKAHTESHTCCGVQDERCIFQGQLLQIREKVEEPSNIKWENLDVTPVERGGRTCIVFFLVLTVMLITFIVIFIANIVKPSNQTSCPTDEITFADAQAKNDGDTTTCFCRQQSFSTLRNDADIQTFCWDIYVEWVSLYIITFATAVTVIVVNFLLKILLRSLGRFSKYPTITRETMGITISLFAAMFVNTALITLMLQADIFGWKPAVSISSPVPPLQDLQQEKATEFAPDFDRGWYTEVGNKITVTMMVNCVSPHLMFLALIPYYRKSRLKKAKKQVIQRDMNSFITGPQFQVTSYYAAVLNTIFVTLFYAPGIPVLLWFGSLSLTIQYWVYKYYILRYNKKPPTYDHKLNKKIITILPFAAILHLMIGIYMYGSPLIFPYDKQSISTTFNSDFAVAEADNSSSTISDRIKNQVFMFVLLITIIALQIIDRTLVVFLKKCYKVFCCVKKINKLSHVAPVGAKDKNKKVFGSYQEEYEGMKQRILSSYDIRLNEDYINLIRAIEVGKQDHEMQLTNRSNQSGPRGSKDGTPANIALEDPNILTPQHKSQNPRKISFTNQLNTQSDNQSQQSRRPSKSPRAKGASQFQQTDNTQRSSKDKLKGDD